MDKEQIKSQRILERYLSGELLVREAREFERFCFTHPEVLNSLPVPARIKERLLRGASAVDTSPAAEVPPSALARSASSATQAHSDDTDDEESHAPKSRRTQTLLRLLGGALAVAVLVGGWLAWRNQAQQQQIKSLRVQVAAVSVRPPARVQLVRLAPGAARPTTADYAVDLREPQLLDLRIDVSGTTFTSFELTIDKVDQARIVEIKRIASDSNKEVRLELNSSAYGAGEYTIELKGYDWRGNTTPVGWLLLAMH